MTFAKIYRYIGSSLWFVPVACVLIGGGLSAGTIALDRAFDYEAIPQDVVGGPDAAVAILGTVATSVVSLAALVLTITMVVVQLAMGQFSPRIVQRILQDKPSQVAIGLFVATFVHAILTLREVTNEGDGTGQVPGIALVTAFLLALASIIVLVIYVHHIGRSLRVAALIELVGDDTRELIDRVYSDRGPDRGLEAETTRVVTGEKSGVVTKIGYDSLVEGARRGSYRLELVPGLGEFVPAGAPLFRVHGEAGDLDEDALRAALILDPERTLDEDVAYGVRLLVDIALRAMADSPLQDPTTTVQAIDRLHDLLRQIAPRPIPDGRHRDASGTVRLVVPAMTWEDYVQLAFDEIRLAGAGSPQVTRRLRAALVDLRTAAPDERRGIIDEQLDLLSAGTRSAFEQDRDVEDALSGDAEGIGVGAGVHRGESHRDREAGEPG